MSGSRQPSRSRLAPSVGHSPADSRHGSPYSRAGGSGHGIVPPNYSQPPVTQPIVASSTDTISSDPGTYPSASSHQTSSDYTSTLVSSPATLDTILSRGNDSWSDQNVLGSMGWENSEAWIEYSELTFPHEQFSTWQQPPQDQEWRLERSATAPIPTTNDNSPALSPIATQATVGYRRQQPSTPRIPSPFTSLDATSEIPYPLVYSNSQIPSTEQQSTATLPSHRLGTAETYAPGPSTAQSGSSTAEQQIVLPSSVEKALAERGRRRTERSRNVRSRSAAPRGISGAKITKVSKGRSKPLSPGAKAKAEDMRYYGACWRCRKYKKPVTPSPSLDGYKLIDVSALVQASAIPA